MSLETVFAWSGLQGNVHHAGSAPGSLVRLLGVCPIPDGAVPPNAPEKWIELTEFANVDPDDFKDALIEWRKAETTGPDVDGDPIDPGLLTKTMSPVDKGRARSAHHAARIRVGIIKSRENQSNDDQSKLTQQCQAISAAGGPSSSSGGTPLMASDVVKLNETVDTTLTGETKLVRKGEMKEMWERCVAVNREPPPIDEEPSEHQMSALLVLLLLHSCYVDFAIWGGHHLRTLKNCKASGLIPGLPDESGRTTLQHQEQRGPPGYHY